LRGRSQTLFPVGTSSNISLPQIGNMHSAVTGCLKDCLKRQNTASLRKLQAKSMTGTSVFSRHSDGVLLQFLNLLDSLYFVSSNIYNNLWIKLELLHHDCPATRYGLGDTPQWCCWQQQLQCLSTFSFLGKFILQNMSHILPHEAAREVR